MDEVKDKCGVIGIYDGKDNFDIARLLYMGLFSLQHRGQESCGIAVNANNEILSHRDMGLVSKVFDDNILSMLKGRHGIGHVRYSTCGASCKDNAQPIIVNYKDGMMAIAHNGNLVNANELRAKMADNGEVFLADSDTELILKRFVYYIAADHSIEKAVEHTMKEITGSYSIVISMPGKLVGFRDPHGIRPMIIGKYKNTYILASESCALDTIGAEIIRDVVPGEIIIIDDDGLHSYQTKTNGCSALCVFEFVYFARPDSYIDGANVYAARHRAGRQLAIEHPVQADLVTAVPDSALAAALGFSYQSGIPFGHGLMRSRYVGRTFIQPTQEMRDSAVKLKFAAIRHEIEGKRIVLVDDSIVRGTTTRLIVQALKNAGAKEVHMRISSPPVKYPCVYGIDIATSKQLIASKLSVEEIQRMIGADSLGYLSIEGLNQIPENVNLGLCTACFNGKYCTDED